MDLTLKDGVSQALAVALKDKFGALTSSENPLAVSSSDETVAVGKLSDDGATLTIDAAGQGKLGTAVITVTDAVDNLSAVVNVTVVPGVPASIELTPVSGDGGAATSSADAAAATTDASTADAASAAAPAADAAATDAAPADAVDGSSAAQSEAAAS